MEKQKGRNQNEQKAAAEEIENDIDDDGDNGNHDDNDYNYNLEDDGAYNNDRYEQVEDATTTPKHFNDSDRLDLNAGW